MKSVSTKNETKQRVINGLRYYKQMIVHGTHIGIKT